MSGQARHARAGRAGAKPAGMLFPLLSALILAAIAAVAVVGIADGHRDPILPIQIRLVQPRLSGLKVRIEHIRSCSCWHGPRDQAQRKYKFRVVNNSDEVVNIDGGVHSILRLIVAYPNHRRPRLTMPAPTSYEALETLSSPPDEPIPVSNKIVPVHASEIKGSNAFFGVPPSYSVWALPAAPNKLAEELEPGNASFPTVVDKAHLLPGEAYEGHRRGHGTWTFYIPLPHAFAQSFTHDGGTEGPLRRETYERYVIFVGVAALEPGMEDGVHLLGFAPAPSDDALLDPAEL